MCRFPTALLSRGGPRPDPQRWGGGRRPLSQPGSPSRRCANSEPSRRPRSALAGKAARRTGRWGSPNRELATLWPALRHPTPPALLTRLSFPPHHQAARGGGGGGGAPLLGPPNFLITWACNSPSSPAHGLASLPRPGAVAGARSVLRQCSVE